MIIKILEAINRHIEKIETVVLIIILSVMVILAFLQVVLRNLLDQGILWADILLRNLVLWVGFIGASLATREGKHINIDLLTRFLPGKWKVFSRIITNMFTALICVLLAEAGWTFVMDEKLYSTKIFADVPAWYFQIIIPIGFLMMAFRFVIISLQHITNLVTQKRVET